MINFIAEVSSNHHRDLERSFDFIDAASSAGCTAVKFQLFKVDLTCLVFSSQFHLETPAPVVDSGFHCDANSSGVLYSRLEWGRTAL